MGAAISVRASLTCPAPTDAQSQLAEVRRKIGGVRSEIPVLDTLGNVTAMLDSIAKQASDYEPQVTTYDSYR